ncbi:hypothetical protein QYM36_009198 [Artemia franciscana]|uniref:Fido domain-containing protein n=1 Tax=Artemia franciscana TaxID=6661 RepID=A0AA88HL80_ARTSF|nr:hypothetical protein QYM36_009198 [Artemia franciscana]
MVKEQDESLLQRCANKNYKSLIALAQLTKDIFKKIEDTTIDKENQYIYNSASIEGNTLTLKHVSMVLEHPDVFNKNNWKPKEITKLRDAVNYPNINLLKIDVNEIIGLKDDLDYLQSILLKKEKKISEESLIAPAQLTKDIFKKIEDTRIDKENQYIYNSASIEGNTLTLKHVKITKLRDAVNYPNINLLKIDVNEIIGLKDALDYLQSILLKKEKEISEEVILKLHYHVLGRVNPKESGVYRRVQVTVGDYMCPHPRRVKSLMDKFYKWLNSDDARKLHPIKYAALAHFKLVSIHPFVDGNGRVSRLLMNLILMKKNYPLVIIHRSNRSEYYQAIRDANLGDISSFVRFIAEETEESLDFILSAISPGDRSGKYYTYCLRRDSAKKL